ncbi:MAG: tRNA (guanine(46)-N(7))-methyltransferase TrmB [Alphaproteobacteria bacterium]
MTPQRLLYGRRRGRRLRPGRQRLIDEALPRIEVTLPATGLLEPASLFDPPVRNVWLEVGFGAGEHLAHQARAHADVGIIGCEPYIYGVAGLLTAVTAERLGNVRVFADDARLLIDALADASIGRLFALFPDPWPKTRHHKRRFVSRQTLDACARVLEDGAELRLATDHVEYCRWMLETLGRHAAFEWLARGPRDWRERPADWPETRYETTTRVQGARPVFLRFRRVPRG